MRQPKLGCRTQTLTSVRHHFLVHNMYIYIQPVLGISPVWKSTKMSQNPLVHFCPHSEPSALDALYPSISDLSSDLTPNTVVDGEKLTAVLLINPTKSTLLPILNRGEVGPKTQARPPVSGSTGNRYFFNLLQSNFPPSHLALNHLNQTQ